MCGRYIIFVHRLFQKAGIPPHKSGCGDDCGFTVQTDRKENAMKLISWNVNGIRACVQKGFLEFFKEADADIFCIQETKMQEGQLALEL